MCVYIALLAWLEYIFQLFPEVGNCSPTFSSTVGKVGLTVGKVGPTVGKVGPML